MDKAKLTPKDVKNVLDQKFKGKTLPAIFWEVAAKELGCSQVQIKELFKLGKKQGLLWKNKNGEIETASLADKSKLFNN